MKIGFIGLGKMGLNMVHRLLLNNHEIVVFDRSKEPIKEAEELGETLATGLEQGCGMAQECSLLFDEYADIVFSANPRQFRMTPHGAGCRTWGIKQDCVKRLFRLKGQRIFSNAAG